VSGGLEDNRHLLSTNINAIPIAMSAPEVNSGIAERFGFEPVAMMLSNRYSPRNRSLGAISVPFNGP
jgi:hypothetical protein